MIPTKLMLEEFNELVQPLIKYLKQNHDPHTRIIISDQNAQLVVDYMGVVAKK